MTGTPIYLVAIAYDDEFKADEARILVKRAHSEGIADVLETTVIVRDREGKKRLTQDGEGSCPLRLLARRDW